MVALLIKFPLKVWFCVALLFHVAPLFNVKSPVNVFVRAPLRFAAPVIFVAPSTVVLRDTVYVPPLFIVSAPKVLDPPLTVSIAPLLIVTDPDAVWVRFALMVTVFAPVVAIITASLVPGAAPPTHVEPVVHVPPVAVLVIVAACVVLVSANNISAKKNIIFFIKIIIAKCIFRKYETTHDFKYISFVKKPHIHYNKLMLKNTDKFSLPGVEEEVLKFWDEQNIFEKSLLKNKPKKGAKGKGKKFIFYEGPPTANGRPGIHHVLGRSYKDVILRFKTMEGYYVPRKGGWDTHGLPVEIEVEKALGLKSKKEIEKYGVAEFNKKCKESVWKYKDEWERLTKRVGFWLDMKDPYVTYKNEYMETIWWTLSEISKKKLLYKGHKIVPWCTRCGTALSSHELAQGYKEVEDASVYIKFKVKKGEKIGDSFVANDRTFILSWTTTPWTLPGNVALAVGEKIDYVINEVGVGNKKEVFILAKSRIEVLEDAGKTIHTVKGKEMIGVHYEPLFPIEAFMSGSAKDVSYKVYPADFVTTEDGTGVVHTAVMYGEDDYKLGKKVGLPEVHTVTTGGTFVDDVKEFAGMYVKSKGTEEKIIQALETKGFLLRKELYKHEYPHCWRCSTPLLYYGRSSWFIEMSKLRETLKKENNTINWIPENIKEGRFGEWIKEAKDWAISRERYWATPLPIWECEGCKTTKVFESINELEAVQKNSGNKYILIRHGEAENNTKGILSSWPEKSKFHLTLKGRTVVEKLAKKLIKRKIDIIFSSDLLRTKETSAILKEKLSVPVIFDERLREINVGKFNGSNIKEYQNFFAEKIEKFTKAPEEGETLTDLRTRVFEFISEMEKKYSGKTIAIVSHEDPLWLLASAMQGWTDERIIAEKEGTLGVFLSAGDMREEEFRVIPRDETGMFDMHRPYIDSVAFPCKKCGSTMKRIPEVLDVWFDSGAMPFAQVHYPFEKGLVPDFPADYICEGMDQTRGWFYTLLAISVLLGKKAPYKNVISLGLILDKNGQKMSKSKGNVVSPWDMVDKHGIDVVRWYFYTVNPPGETKKFDELELAKTSRQFFTLIYNSFIFFDLYSDRKFIPKSTPKPNHILDKWIMARLHETIDVSTKHMDKYEVGDAARLIEEFVGDLSRWYIRRSRRRLQKPESRKDFESVSTVFGYTLVTLAKLMAPFSPFFAEALHKSLAQNVKVSVHLEDWPKAEKKLIDKNLIEGMAEVRLAASIALAKRAEKGIKVRQPLAELKLKSIKLEGKKALLEILKDEVNVKKISFDKELSEDVELDTNVSRELMEEGLLRDLVRMIQDLRQEAGFSPKDVIVLHIECPEELSLVLRNNESFTKREVNAKAIEFKRVEHSDAELKTKLGEHEIWIAVRRNKK